MTAGIIANAEQPGRYKIDRSGVVSKYVGETDKRLNKVFLKVEPNNLVLFLDGAELLMGKRLMGKNARDQHGGRHEKWMLVQNLREIQRALVNLPRCGI